MKETALLVAFLAGGEEAMSVFRNSSNREEF